MKKQFVYLALGIIIVLGLLAGCASQGTPTPTASPTQPAQKISVLMSGPPSSWSMYPIVVGVADIANRNSNLDITVRSQSGSLAVTQSVAQGQSQLGGGAYDSSAAQGYFGTGDFKGTRHTNLRTVIPVRVSRLTFLTPEKTGIKSFADLKGKKVAWPLDRGSVIYYKPIVAAAGLDPEKDVTWVQMPTGDEAMEALRMGRVDAFGDNLEGAELLELSQAVGKLVPLPITPEMLASARAKDPTPFIGYVTTTLDPGYRPALAISGQISVLATPFTVTTNESVSDEIIGAFVTALVNNQNAVKQITVDVADFGPAVISLPSAMPYHKAAIEALKKANLWTEAMQKAHDEVLTK